MSSLSLALPSSSSSSRPSSCQISPLPLASILDHHLRRTSSQDRVFGTLLGVRHEATNSIEIRNSFGVPYAANGGEVTVDMDHHRALLELSLKVNPKEVVVGWYATSPELNSFSALIHAFYTLESSSPAIHLTLDPSTLAFQSYLSSPIGLSPRADQLAFLPLETTLAVHDADRPAVDLLASANSPSASPAPISPMAALDGLLSKVESMLEQTGEYVDKVVKGEVEGDVNVGRKLLESVGSVPLGAEFEETWNAHLADVLMVSYLANVISTQTEISSRLNLLV